MSEPIALDDAVYDLLNAIKNAKDEDIPSILFDKGGVDPAAFRAFLEAEGASEDPDALAILSELEKLKAHSMDSLTQSYPPTIFYVGHGVANMIDNVYAMPVLQLAKRNKLAEALIAEYAIKNAALDFALGWAGLVPGAAISTLSTAISARSVAMYLPLARKLADVYFAPPAELVGLQVQNTQSTIVKYLPLTAETVPDTEFVRQIASELMYQFVAAAAFQWVPFMGRAIASGISGRIASTLTNRIGKMMAIYFQNGGKWAGDKYKTYADASKLSNNLNDIRKMAGVNETLVQNTVVIVEKLRVDGMDSVGIRRTLSAEGVPDDLIDGAWLKIESRS